jgi:TP901 family phage tail tape measure protein
MADDITLGIKIKLDGKDVDGQLRILTSDIEKLARATQSQGQSARESAQQTEEQAKSMRGLRQSARDAADAIKNIGSTAANAVGNVTGLKQDIEGLRGGLIGFAATVAAVGLQTAKAISFESSFSDVRKVVEGSRAELQKLSSDLKTLSTNISVPLAGLNEIAAQGGQLGLPIRELTDFTQLVSKVSVGFALLPAEAGQAIGTLRNIYQLSMAELEQFGDQINTVADNSNTSERELLNLVTRVGDTAQQFGLLRSETLGLSAAILSLGKPPEVAATALENMLTSLRNANMQSKDFREGLNSLGIDAGKLAQDIDKHPKEALEGFLKTLESLDSRSRSGVIAQLFGKGQDAVVLNQLISQLNEYRRIVGLAQNESVFSGSLSRTFEEREKTATAALQRMGNAFSTLAINVGQVFLPVVSFAADKLRDLAAGLANFAENSPNATTFAQISVVLLPLAGAFRLLAAGVGLIAPAIAPAIAGLRGLIALASSSGVIAAITAGVAGLGAAFSSLAGGVVGRLVIGIGAAAAAFSGLGGALALIVNPLTLFAAGATLIVARIAGAGSALGGLVSGLGVLGRGLLALVGGPIGAGVAGLTFLGVKFLQIKDDAIEFGGVQTTVGGVVGAAWDVIKDKVGSAADGFGSALTEMGSGLLELVGINEQTWNAIGGAFAEAGQTIAEFARDSVNTLIRGFVGLSRVVGEEFDYLINTVATKFKNIVGIAKAAGDDVRNAFSGEFSIDNLSAALAAADTRNQQNLSNTTDRIRQSLADIGNTDYVGLLVEDFKVGADKIGDNIKTTIAKKLQEGVKHGLTGTTSEERKNSGGRSLPSAPDETAAKAAEKYAKAEGKRREEIAKTIEQIRQETALIGLSDKERARSVELTQALTKAKGEEAAAITAALNTKWAELDADQRRNDMWAVMVDQANAQDKLHDDAAEAQRLATLAQELKVQGLSNTAIRDRIELEKQLAGVREANPDLDPAQVENYVNQRAYAEKTISEIMDDGSQKSADFMESAFKRAAENIQDTLASMFENLLNGDATGSFDDFMDNIRRSMTRVFSQDLSTSLQSWLQGAFTKGNTGSTPATMGGGLFDWLGGLFGGSSGGSYFKGNGPLLSYQNGSGIGGMFSSLFSTGSGGGFSMSGAGGGGFGWGALASLANLIPGAGQVNWKGQQQNKSLDTVIGMENMVTDMVGNFFPLFKLVAPLKNMIMNFGADLFPDRKPSLMGHMLGQAFGPLGDLLGTFLLGSKIPQPTEWTKGRYSNGKMTVGASQAFEGGDTKNTIDFTTGFGNLVTSLGHQLNMTFRDFRTMFWHQLDKGGDNQFAGGIDDKGGKVFYRQLSEGGDFNTLASQASIALIKRNIASQDDLHYRQAIRDSNGIKGLSNRVEQIDKIGLAIGEYGQALQQLKAINAEFDDMAIKASKYRFAEADIEAARQRAIDALKNDTITAFHQLAGLGPTLAAQLADLSNQLIALEANARSLKIAESDLLGLRAKAIALAKEQYLAPLTDVSASINDQIASLTGVLPQPEDVAPLYQLLAASTDPTEQARYIDRIQRALSQRYNVELAQINKIGLAVNNLKAFVDGLKLSDLSPLDPLQRFQEAKGQYGTKLLKAQAGDQAALADLPNAAQAYLTEARSYYASTPEYASIFGNVTSTLESLGASMGGSIDADSAASDAANALAASLTSLNDVVKQIIANQGAAFNQQAGNVGAGAQGPAKDFRDITEDQMAASIDALPDNATKAQRQAVQALNKQLASQIKAWLFGGEEELAKTQAYQELTGAIKEIQAEIKGTKKGDPQRNYLRAQLSGLMAQRKALGKVKFKEQGGWTDGMTIVGENGPELINFARPTQVQSNRQTQSIIAGGNDMVVSELQKANKELAALVRLQVKANQALLDRLDQIASASSSMERKARLAGAA